MAKKEEIIDVVHPIQQGNPSNGQSLYILMPSKLKSRLNITTSTNFVVLVSDGDIIYRKQEA